MNSNILVSSEDKITFKNLFFFSHKFLCDSSLFFVAEE